MVNSNILRYKNCWQLRTMYFQTTNIKFQSVTVSWNWTTHDSRSWIGVLIYMMWNANISLVSLQMGSVVHCEAHHTHKQISQHFYFSEGKIKISFSVNFICVAGGIVSTWRIGRRDFETSPVGVGKPWFLEWFGHTVWTELFLIGWE